MRKNFIYGMAAIASMLFATSCSQEVLQEETANLEYINASFDVNGPEGINSRAIIGDGTSVNTLVCATFDERGNELEALRQYLDFKTQTAIYKVRLVKGQDYRVAFFAYYDGEDEGNQPDYYNIDDLKNIKVLNEQVSNVELRDAFTAYHDIKNADDNNGTMQPIKQTVTLYRPFAQLNLGSRYDDWNDAIKAGVEISQTKVIVKNVYKIFSAYEDKVVGNATPMIFDFNSLPNEDLVVKAKVENDYNYKETQGKAYKYLAMNYLLVGDKDSEENLADIEFIWKTADGKTNNPKTTFLNVPVERNCRTNIIGWLLTNPAEFNINIDAKFKNDYDIVAIDGTVNVEDVAEVLPNDGYMDEPENVATIANKHITAEGTAIIANELPEESRGVLYIKNSTINAESFLEIQNNITVVIKNCHLNITDILAKNTSSSRTIQLIFSDCYVNGELLTKDNIDKWLNWEGNGTVMFDNSSENQGGNQEPTDPEQGGNTGGGDNTGNEGEGGDDNTGGENQGIVNGNVNMSEVASELGEITTDSFFTITDKTFGGTVTLDKGMPNSSGQYSFIGVTFAKTIKVTGDLTLAFENVNFNETPAVQWSNSNTTNRMIMLKKNTVYVNGTLVTKDNVKTYFPGNSYVYWF